MGKYCASDLRKRVHRAIPVSIVFGDPVLNRQLTTPMKMQRAVFVGAARNCAVHLPGVLRNLASLAALYGDCAFVFAVSDCVDNTRFLLEQWLQQGRQGSVIDLGTLLEELPERTARIAVSRNACISKILSSGYASYDHLVVVDLDDVLALPILVSPFVEAIEWLGKEPSRAGVFANSAPRYYDIWALRHDIWCPHDCWHAIWERGDADAFGAAKMREVYARQIQLPTALPPLRVRSAFGGLGIYKMKYAIGAHYSGIDALGREVAEHVSFNFEIGRRGGELFIFPPLVVSAPPQHLFQAKDEALVWIIEMLGIRLREWWSPSWQRLYSSQFDLAKAFESPHH